MDGSPEANQTSEAQGLSAFSFRAACHCPDRSRFRSMQGHNFPARVTPTLSATSQYTITPKRKSCLQTAETNSAGDQEFAECSISILVRARMRCEPGTRPRRRFSCTVALRPFGLKILARRVHGNDQRSWSDYFSGRPLNRYTWPLAPEFSTGKRLLTCNLYHVKLSSLCIIYRVNFGIQTSGRFDRAEYETAGSHSKAVPELWGDSRPPDRGHLAAGLQRTEPRWPDPEIREF